jgi:hypothetical protein
MRFRDRGVSSLQENTHFNGFTKPTPSAISSLVVVNQTLLMLVHIGTQPDQRLHAGQYLSR